MEGNLHGRCDRRNVYLSILYKLVLIANSANVAEKKFFFVMANFLVMMMLNGRMWSRKNSTNFFLFAFFFSYFFFSYICIKKSDDDYETCCKFYAASDYVADQTIRLTAVFFRGNFKNSKNLEKFLFSLSSSLSLKTPSTNKV